MGDVLFVGSTEELEHLSYANPGTYLRSVGSHPFVVLPNNAVNRVTRALLDADALILGSNVLRSETLTTALQGHLGESLRERLAAGMGLVVLHQLPRGVDSPIRIDFLGEGLGASAIRRSAEEGTEGTLEEADLLQRHESLLLPDGVEVPELQRELRAQGPQGVYWHYWEPDSRERWRVVLSDSTHNRPLLWEHMSQGSAGRIILSALPLDWLDEPKMLGNLARLAADGSLDVALAHVDTVSFELYDIATELESQGHAVLRYGVSEQHASTRLELSLKGGMHETLIVQSRSHHTSATWWSSALRRVQEGTLRVVVTGDTVDEPLVVYSSESRYRNAFSLRSSEFLSAFRGVAPLDSIWRTADSLWVLRDELDPSDFDIAMKQLGHRVANGAVDATPVPTAMYMWMKSRSSVPEIADSVRWLESRVGGLLPGDVLRIGLWVLRSGSRSAEIDGACQQALARPTDGTAQTTLAAMQYCVATRDLRAIRLAQEASAIDPALWQLGSLRNDLLEVLLEMAEVWPNDEEVRVAVADLAPRVALEIRQSFGQLTDGSPGQLLKASAVLSRYETRFASPTQGVVALASNSSGQVESTWAVKAGADYAHYTRQELARLRDENQVMSRQLVSLRRRANARRPLLALLLLFVYACIAVVIAALVAGGTPAQVVIETAWSARDVHVAVLIALVTGLAAWVYRGRERGGTASPEGS